MILEPEITLELSVQFLEKCTVGIEPRYFVLVLVGHQLEQVARDRLRKPGASPRARGFGCFDHRYRIAVALRIRRVLVVGEEGGAALDHGDELLQLRRRIMTRVRHERLELRAVMRGEATPGN